MNIVLDLVSSIFPYVIAYYVFKLIINATNIKNWRKWVKVCVLAIPYILLVGILQYGMKTAFNLDVVGNFKHKQPIVQVSEADSIQITQLLVKCMQGDTITDMDIEKYQAISKKYPGNNTISQNDLMNGQKVVSLFYKDAISSLKEKRLIRSNERVLLEKPSEHIRNDSIIVDIINGKPIYLGDGSQYVLDEQSLNNIYSNLDGAYKKAMVNINRLQKKI